MPLRECFKFEFDTSTGDLTENDLISQIDFSRADIIVLTVLLTDAATETDDTLTIYLQSRGPSGYWEDRIATAQFLGDQSTPKAYRYNLMKWADLSSSEEAGEIAPGSTGSHISAGTVVHGPFPGRFMATRETPQAGWRLVFAQSDSGTDNANFAGSVWIELDTPDRSG